MHIHKSSPLAVALLLFGATSASAFAIHHEVRGGPLPQYAPSDTVIVDVFLDVEPGLSKFSVGLLYPDDGTITYDPIAAFNLAPHPSAEGNSGALSSYILYARQGGFGGFRTTLYPAVDNSAQGYPGSNFFTNWAGANQPGKLQVNVDYADDRGLGAPVSGTDIYIATLLFRIGPGFTGATVELCLTCGGNEFIAEGVAPPGSVALSAPIVLNAPEPATALLIGFGVLAAVSAARREPLGSGTLTGVFAPGDASVH